MTRRNVAAGVAQVAGLAALVYGLYLVHIALAWSVAGIAVLLAGVAFEKDDDE